jgi:hypothetical protein
MNTDEALARLRVTSKCVGDIGLRKGGAQKFPKVEFTHLSERWVNRSSIVVSDIYERDHLLSRKYLEIGSVGP